jgi:hypothetical protein
MSGYRTSNVTWAAHTEFTLRPRYARTGAAGHDKLCYATFESSDNCRFAAPPLMSVRAMG